MYNAFHSFEEKMDLIFKDQIKKLKKDVVEIIAKASARGTALSGSTLKTIVNLYIETEKTWPKIILLTLKEQKFIKFNKKINKILLSNFYSKYAPKNPGEFLGTINTFAVKIKPIPTLCGDLEKNNQDCEKLFKNLLLEYLEDLKRKTKFSLIEKFIILFEIIIVFLNGFLFLKWTSIAITQKVLAYEPMIGLLSLVFIFFDIIRRFLNKNGHVAKLE